LPETRSSMLERSERSVFCEGPGAASFHAAPAESGLKSRFLGDINRVAHFDAKYLIVLSTVCDRAAAGSHGCSSALIRRGECVP
jgi:hypothetical protein